MPTTFPQDAKDAAEAIFKRNPNAKPADVAEKLDGDFPGAGITKDVIRNWAARGGWRPGIGSAPGSRTKNLPTTLGSKNVPAVRKTNLPATLTVVPVFTAEEKELLLRLVKNNASQLQRKMDQGWEINPDRIKKLKKSKTGMARNSLTLPERIKRSEALVPKIEGLAIYK